MESQVTRDFIPNKDYIYINNVRTTNCDESYSVHGF